ncbi:MAG TPA: hypothetical protein VE776_02350 [Actinomycetota bacterium]|nr:hypothetical protein [Actinomycetota bacterium]
MSVSSPPPEWSAAWPAKVAWLPPFGHGNGLDAPSWAPIADVDHALADPLLEAFQDAGVPAHAAPVGLAPRRRPKRRRGRSPTAQYRVWVGSQWYATAEDVLRVELPRLRAANPPAGR